jgi:hypothetical protein
MRSIIAATKRDQNATVNSKYNTNPSPTSKLDGQYVEDFISTFKVEDNLIPVSTRQYWIEEWKLY